MTNRSSGRQPSTGSRRRARSLGGFKRNNMNCTLCGNQINNYNPVFNHIDINDSHSADICPECIQKIIKLQQNTYVKLFPTKFAKKLIEKRKQKK